MGDGPTVQDPTPLDGADGGGELASIEATTPKREWVRPKRATPRDPRTASHRKNES